MKTICKNKPKNSENKDDKPNDFSKPCLNIIRSMTKKENPCLDVLIIGDSVMSVVSTKDNNKTNLFEMLLTKLKSYEDLKVDGIYHTGFHFGTFYLILHLFNFFNKLPSLVVLPINIRSFLPQWDKHPDYHKDPICEIYNFLRSSDYDFGNTYGIEKPTTYDDYITTKENYPFLSIKSNGEFLAWVDRKTGDQKEYFERYRQIFIWHHLASIDDKNRKYLFLKQIIELLTQNGVKLYCYITPINYLKAEEFVGIDFKYYFEKNISIIKQLFLNKEKTNLCFFNDFSRLLKPSYFIHENESAEHLNIRGRRNLTDMVLKNVKELIKTKTKSKKDVYL
ncbi:MAG: hypothetical protein V3V70_04125 [Candidatus Scalindua sp.]